jgi:hypothetical protein
MILGPYDTQSKFHDKVFWGAVLALTIATAIGGYFIRIM